MLSFCVSFASSAQLNIANETITTLRLQSGDSVFVNATARSVFLQVQSYYFTGDLVINASYPSGTATHTGFPGARLHFANTTLIIALSNSFTMCSVSVYLIPPVCSPRSSVHSRSIKSAVSTMLAESGPFCWFFDFVVNGTAFEVQGSGAGFEVIQNSESGSLAFVDLSMVSALNSAFVLVGRPGGGASSVSFSIDRLFCDWTERDYPFRECRENGDCEVLEVEIAGFLTSMRSIAGWIWLVLYGVPAVVGCSFIGAILVFQRAETWKPASLRRPLLSDYGSNMLLNDPGRYI
jgi:hypothetical protein